MNKKIFKGIVAVASTLVFMAGFSGAESFTYVGSDILNSNSWQNDSDSTTGNLPGSGDTGTIAMNGTVGTGNFGGALAGSIINHTSGKITGTFNMNSTGLIYNLQGGTIDNANNFNANGMTVNLTSGLLQFSGDLIINQASGRINLSGSATIEADSGDFDLRINSAGAEFNISADWTGSLVSNNDATEAHWIAELVYGAVATGTGTSGVNAVRLVSVGGTDITADNFGDFFVVTPDGSGGSSLALTLTPAPVLDLASPFQNRMVLQRGKPINVWGTSDPSAAVSVSINGTTVSGTADASGNWQIELPSQSAGGPHSLVATSGSATRTITDVLFGDVWFCFGQSNMVRPLSEMTGSSNYITAISGNDNIRCLKIDQDATLTEDESAGMNWLDNSSAGTWTSVGSVFAHQLYTATNVPVAIVWAAWGSSSIEGWMPLELRGQLPHFDEMMNLYQSISEYQSGATTSSRLPSIYNTNADGIAGLIANGWSSSNDDIFMRTRPNIIYNKMIHPMRKYGISGFIWYQGEANGGNITDCARYGFSLPRLVTEYRERFDQGDLPFLGVQLPSHNKTHWPWFREAQGQLETLNNAHVAMTIDTGSSSNIHPTDKEPIGIRLSLLARKYALGESIVAHGPSFGAMSVSGSDVTITFTNASGMNAGASAGLFQIAGPGASPTFYNADSISVSGSQVTISSTSVTDPQEVRYAWIPVPNAQTTLENSSGIPAAPFRTDAFALPGLGAQIPQGIDDTYETTQNTALNISAKGVLINDIDLNHDTLTASLVTNVNHGTLSLISDGSFTYTPHNGFAGTDSFSYKCNDGSLTSTDTTVTITVNGTQTAYYSWRTGISWNPGDDQTKTGDPDLDGIDNFLEFALSLDPLAASTGGLPKVTNTDANFIYYDFNNARAGIAYEVLLSTDLNNWNTPPFATLTNTSTTPVKIPRTEEVDGRLFLRLRVSEQ
ncbi:MAG: sialate O-acetylesterase [Akkermansiaceae bacterium]